MGTCWRLPCPDLRAGFGLQESRADFAGRFQPRRHALPERLGFYKVRRSGVDVGGNGIGAFADTNRRFSMVTQWLYAALPCHHMAWSVVVCDAEIAGLTNDRF